MHTSRGWKALTFAFLTAALTLIPGGATQAHAQDSTSGAAPLEGTWRVYIQLHNCKTGADVGKQFLSLLTFAGGGTMTETTSNPMFYPAERGPGHGVWSRTGTYEYSAATLALISLNGALVQLQTIRQTIEMTNDPNSFTTPRASVKFFSPSGTLLRAGCATAVGKRFQ